MRIINTNASEYFEKENKQRIVNEIKQIMQKKTSYKITTIMIKSMKNDEDKNVEQQKM